MTRFKLALILCAGLMTIGSLMLAFYMKRPSGPGNAPQVEPVSYAKPVGDGSRVLVVFGDSEAEAKLTDRGTKEYAAQVRADYPEPGLYEVGTPPRLIYPLAGYAPDDQVFLSEDGTHLIRVEGNSWKTKAYPAGKRLETKVEEEQLQAPALSCFTNGRLTHQYTLAELVSNPIELPHSPEHILWPAGAVLNKQTGQFHLFTQDSQKITINVATGELVSKSSTGIGNPIAQIILTSVVVATVLLAGGIVFLAVRNSRGQAKLEQSTAQPHRPS
jgi:hypothetical protein